MTYFALLRLALAACFAALLCRAGASPTIDAIKKAGGSASACSRTRLAGENTPGKPAERSAWLSPTNTPGA